MNEAARAIQQRAPGFTPRVGLVLGSGLGALVDELADAVHIPYSEIPGFRVGTVVGHAGALSLGTLDGTPVACFQGRSHVYEGIEASAVTTPVRTLRLLGAEILVLTNAAGSLREEVGAGSLMAITDHINFTGVNPLFGLGAGDNRFVDMVDAYDHALTQRLLTAAKAANILCHDGVYIWFCGPSFETPAEIRAARTLGADAVGMSTVPETILARHAGLKVVGLSLMTNYAAGMSHDKLGHEQTMAVAREAAGKVRGLLRAFLEAYD